MEKILLGVLSLLLILVISCKKHEDPELVEINPSSLSETTPTITKSRVWSSENIKLPKGVVVKSDCANCGSSNGTKDLTDNYVTIKDETGHLIIVRDIDVDTYLNLHDGDSIK